MTGPRYADKSEDAYRYMNRIIASHSSPEHLTRNVGGVKGEQRRNYGVGERNLKYRELLNDADPTDPIKKKKRKGSCLLNYNELMRCWRKGTRNGNWRRLGTIDKVFYRAAMWYARGKSKIINNKIVVQLKSIVGKLENTIRKKIMSVGTERAKDNLTKFEENGVFNWAPRLKTWLIETKYVFWLGLDSQRP